MSSSSTSTQAHSQAPSQANTQAHQVFTAARAKLEAALSEYSTACKQLQTLTGEFTGADQRLALQFHTATGTPARADIVLTDC